MRLDLEPRSYPLSLKPADPDEPVRVTPEERAAQLSKAGRAFEGFLLGELLKTMRNAEGQSGGIVPVNRAEKVFINQQCEALGEALAQREPLGLARMLRGPSRPQGQAGVTAPAERDTTTADASVRTVSSMHRRHPCSEYTLIPPLNASPHSLRALDRRVAPARLPAVTP